MTADNLPRQAPSSTAHHGDSRNHNTSFQIRFHGDGLLGGKRRGWRDQEQRRHERVMLGGRQKEWIPSCNRVAFAHIEFSVHWRVDRQWLIRAAVRAFVSSCAVQGVR